eukprot:g47435.t1
MKQEAGMKSKICTFAREDKVLVLLPVLGDPFKGKCSGPYQIMKELSQVKYLVNMPDRKKNKLYQVPKEVEAMLQEDIIKLSQSERISLIVLVPKPYGEFLVTLIAFLDAKSSVQEISVDLGTGPFAGVSGFLEADGNVKLVGCVRFSGVCREPGTTGVEENRTDLTGTPGVNLGLVL